MPCILGDKCACAYRGGSRGCFYNVTKREYNELARLTKKKGE